MEVLESQIMRISVVNNSEFGNLYDSYCRKLELENSVRAKKQEIAATKAVLQLDELKARKRILRRLGFVTSTDIIEIKGRQDCSKQRLYLTDLQSCL